MTKVTKARKPVKHKWTEEEVNQLVKRLYINYIRVLNKEPSEKEVEEYILLRTINLPKNHLDIWFNWPFDKALSFYYRLNRMKGFREIKSLHNYLSYVGYPGLPTPLREELLGWDQLMKDFN